MRISDWSSDVCSSDLVLVDALEAVIAQAHLECRQRAALKETQHPAVEHQFLMEAALLAAATGTGCATCARTGGRGLAWSCHQMRSEERRVGNACVSPCRSRGWPVHSKKNKQTT